MSLLTEPVLLVDQVTSFLSNDFDVLDAQGTPVGRIATGGGLLSRMVLGSRELTVLDADGAPQVRVQDVMGLGRDRYELTGPDGHPLASIRKELTLAGLRLTVEAADGPVEAAGSFFEWDFTVARPQRQVAAFHRTYAGIGRALLGHNRYVVAFDPAATEDDRRITLGIAVAVDLVRAKRRRSSSSSSSL